MARMQISKPFILTLTLTLSLCAGAIGQPRAADLSILLMAAQSAISSAMGDTGARRSVVVDPWMPLAELTASDGAAYRYLGASVSISGNTVVATGAGNAAYVFVKPASGWGNMTQTAMLTASDGRPLNNE